MGKVNALFQDEKERLCEEIAIDYRLHPDDDCDRIEEILCELYPNYCDDPRDKS